MSSSSAAASMPRDGVVPAEAGDDEPSGDAVHFDAVVTPHRALSDRATLIVMAVLFGVSFALQAALAAAGLWFASAFLFADTAFLIVALAVFRLTETRCERVLVAGATVSVERTGPRGLTERRVWPAWGLAIEVDADPDYGCRALRLAHRGRRDEIARDLSPAERAAFLAAFSAALRQAGFPPRLETRTAPPLRFA